MNVVDTDKISFQNQLHKFPNGANMTGKVRLKGEQVRQFIMDKAEVAGASLCHMVMEQFGITRQAVNRHLAKLTEQGFIVPAGISGRSRIFKLAQLECQEFSYRIEPHLAEDLVWEQDIRSLIHNLPENVLRLWSYAFTEMFNNAIDHSGGSAIRVSVTKTAVTTAIRIADNGVGIFKKIQAAMGLLDERHAIFELSKGKLTTDPRNHSGQGIFFTSRMCDRFSIASGELLFQHVRGDGMDWLGEQKANTEGTTVLMELSNHTAQTTKKIFDEYSSGDDYGFTKTVVPVQLAKYGSDELVSRSQAKRLLARVELFRTVVFDFAGVEEVGQAFADQIFRVFATEHPEIDLIPIRMNHDVTDMVRRAVNQPRV
ncbi:MAG: DUF4325 domain-containing protein [Giesbergeria sp.]|nr:DUF4325 domain-containing protein [Giesbergeria sp.]